MGGDWKHLERTIIDLITHNDSQEECVSFGSETMDWHINKRAQGYLKNVVGGYKKETPSLKRRFVTHDNSMVVEAIALYFVLVEELLDLY